MTPLIHPFSLFHSACHHISSTSSPLTSLSHSYGWCAGSPLLFGLPLSPCRSFLLSLFLSRLSLFFPHMPPCPFFTFLLAFLPLSSRLAVSLESLWVPYHSFPVLPSSALYSVSVKSAVCRRLKVLCKRTLPLSWMYLYSCAQSAEAAPVLCSSSSKVLSSPHHWPTLVVSYTWLLGAVVNVCLMCQYLCLGARACVLCRWLTSL